MPPTLASASRFLFILACRASPASGFVLEPSLPLSPLALSPKSSRIATNGGSIPLSAVREATFGMGCFWEPAESLLKQPGVLATTVGYTGAPPNKPPPTYDSVCFGNDWVEAVRVAYDDELVSYNQLLDYFFQLQKPAYSRQYASIIFVNDATEAKDAKQWKKESVSSGKQERGDNLSYDVVDIESASPFFRAEEYHQRYWEKQRLRLLLGLTLIAGESGAYNEFFDGALGKVEIFGLSFESACGAFFFVSAAWLLLERLIARDVQELKQGDLITLAKQN